MNIHDQLANACKLEMEGTFKLNTGAEILITGDFVIHKNDEIAAAGLFATLEVYRPIQADVVVLKCRCLVSNPKAADGDTMAVKLAAILAKSLPFPKTMEIRKVGWEIFTVALLNHGSVPTGILK